MAWQCAHPPISGDKPRILILGTFPGRESRDQREYYANTRNTFWRIMFDSFSVPFDNPDYEAKKSVLTDNGVALWDTVICCRTDGARDTDIQKPVYNVGLPEFIRENGIELLLFNSGNAFTYYKRGNGKPAVAWQVLPSTSPTFGHMRYDEKLAAWSEWLKNARP